MKKLTMPMMLLLLLVLPRNISAKSAVQTGSSQTIDGMIKGTEFFIEVMNWFNVNIKNAYFDETIRDLQNLVYSLPTDLGVDASKILQGLSKSRNRFITTRSILEKAATNLKVNCQHLINMYDRYDDSDGSMRLIQTTAAEFAKYGEIVMGQLEEAMTQLKEIGDELSDTASLLQELNSGLVHKVNEINEQEYKLYNLRVELENTFRARIRHMQYQQRRRNEELNRTRLLVGIFTLGIGSIIAEPVVANIKYGERRAYNNEVNRLQSDVYSIENNLNGLYRELSVLRTTVDRAGTKIHQLIISVDEIKVFVRGDINLIAVWKSGLNEAVDEHEDGISPLAIKFGIKKIKRKLNVLIEACDNYLNH